MKEVGDAYRRAGVAAIYLIHGTFVGNDAFGFFRTIGNALPRFKRKGQEIAKYVIDALAKDAGNYTQEYADKMGAALNRDGERHIPVKLFHWSGANHHIGRAEAAIQLIAELNELGKSLLSETPITSGDSPNNSNPEIPSRVLIWAHSHGGNALALMTNLLGAEPESVNKFFDATRSYYKWPLLGRVDMPEWNEVQRILLESRHNLNALKLDLCTFGTPIRYGWDSNGYEKLLHFVNHRPGNKDSLLRAPFPPRLERMKTAEDGDYIHHLGIAGTNFMPSIFQWRTLLSDLRLNRFLQPGLRRRDLNARLRHGLRIANDGTTLLVDYGAGEGSVTNHVLGHAVYTRLSWLQFHAEHVANTFYSMELMQKT